MSGRNVGIQRNEVTGEVWKMKGWIWTLIVIALVVLSMVITRAIVNSDLPMWFKVWILR